MSSRGEFVGSGPNAGIYQSKPIPAKPEDLSVYLNDELLSLGGKLNNVIEGGVFPPQSELPKRFREGMTVFFTQPVSDKERGIEITSSGVWLYTDGKWWKMINDPSALNQTLSVYKTLPHGSSMPKRPPKDKFLENDLEGWSYTPANQYEHTEQWMSVAANATVGEQPKVEWSEPILFNTQGDIGPPGENGYSSEERFLASTKMPTIKDDKDRFPETNDGSVWQTNPPKNSHPDKSFIWVISAQVRGTEVFDKWFGPTRYSTPDTTQIAIAYAVSRGENYPDFNPSAPKMPGVDWTPTEPDIPQNYYLWRTERLEWTDGTQQSNWITPFKVNTVEGSIIENRYLASTDSPTIDDVNAREPMHGNEVFTTDIPVVSHPNKDFVWNTVATIDRFGEVIAPWTEPVKYSTPDSTIAGRAYAVGDKSSYPSFTPSAEDLPGSQWQRETPTDSVGRFVWYTERLEWSDGTKQTDWTTPIRLTGEDGAIGHNGSGTYTIVNDSAATTWPSDASVWFEDHTGRKPVLGDILNFVNNASDKIQTRIYQNDKWEAFASVINGNQIVKGTIVGDRIQANTSISAPTLIGGRVEAGVINGGTIKGTTVDAVSFTGTNVLGTGTITGGTISGTRFTNGSSFNVTSGGILTASDANITGTITATGGSFTGSINATSGTFRGTVSGGTVDGGQILGSKIQVPRTGTAKFTVDEHGNLTCNNASINGKIHTNGSYQNGEIVGSRLSIGRDNSSPFIGYDGLRYNTVIPADGKIHARNCHITGHVDATSGTFNNVTINENCDVKGTIYANKIVGDIVSSKAIHSTSKSWSYKGGFNTGWVTVVTGTLKPDSVNHRTVVVTPPWGDAHAKGFSANRGDCWGHGVYEARLLINGSVNTQRGTTWASNGSKTSFDGIVANGSMAAVVNATSSNTTIEVQVRFSGSSGYSGDLYTSQKVSLSLPRQPVVFEVFRNGASWL